MAASLRKIIVILSTASLLAIIGILSQQNSLSRTSDAVATLPRHHSIYSFNTMSDLSNRDAQSIPLVQKAVKELKSHPSFLESFKNPCWFGAGNLSCLPYFYLLGYPKCGTTKLYNLLKIHPHYASSKIKEPHYWRKQRNYISYSNITGTVELKPSISKYAKVFKTASSLIYSSPGQMITGDCSASTAWDLPFGLPIEMVGYDAIPYMIHSILPNAKFIVIMRNPSDRLRSEYYYFGIKYKYTLSADDFHELTIAFINAYKSCTSAGFSELHCIYSRQLKYAHFRPLVSMYYYSLARWFKYFKREQFLLLTTDELAEDELTVALQMYQFLGLAKPNAHILNLVQKREGRQVNSIKKRMSKYHTSLAPTVHNKTIKILNQFFEPFNAKLASLVGDNKFLWKASY